MTAAVIDASALIALLRREPGGNRVAEVLHDSAMTTVNLAEVVGHFARTGVAEAAIRAILSPMPMNLVAVDAGLAYDIGLLLPLTRSSGLSLGDRACLALARRLGVPALTADRSWATIAQSIGVTVELIRR